MWLLCSSEFLTCSVVLYRLNTTSMYFTERLYSEAFQKQACRKSELSEHPLMNLSSTSEYYIAPHQPKAGYSHEVSFPLTYFRIWSPLNLSLPHSICSAHRFSQPSSGFLLQIRTSLVSCWIRLWDFTLQSFFLLRSCNISRYSMPFWCYRYFSGCPEKPFISRLITTMDAHFAVKFPKKFHHAVKTFQIIIIWGYSYPKIFGPSPDNVMFSFKSEDFLGHMQQQNFIRWIPEGILLLRLCIFWNAAHMPFPHSLTWQISNGQVRL